MELILLPLLLLAGLFATMDGGSDGGDVSGAGDDDDTLEGSGNDQVAGGAGDDLLTLSENSVGFGGEGDDTLTALDSATAYGRAGDDVLTGSDNSTVMGGDGNDMLTIHDRAQAFGGAGDDTLVASEIFTSGTPNVTGGAGAYLFVADLTAAEDGARLLVSDYEAGSDRIGIMIGDHDIADLTVQISESTSPDPGEFSGTVLNISLVDTVTNSAFGSFRLEGVTDFDPNDIVIFGNDLTNALDWQPPPAWPEDTLTGAGAETVNGGDGNDEISVSDSAVGHGGAGNDMLFADDTAQAFGLEGDDSLQGAGNSTIMGGDGADVLSASGSGEAHGGRGADNLTLFGDITGFAGWGDDRVTAMNDVVAHGGEGDDYMAARDSATVHGGAGDDWLTARESASLDGGDGNDTMFAGNSSDGPYSVAASGGAGEDLFIISDLQIEGSEADPYLWSTPMVISDFNPAQDQLGIIADDPRLLAGLHIHQSYSATLGTTTVQLRETATNNTVVSFTLLGQHQIEPSDLVFFSDASLDPISFDFTGTTVATA